LLGDGIGVRSVVIKLMQEKTQWERERRARNLNTLDQKYVVQEVTGVPTIEEIATAVAAGSGGLLAIKPYLPKDFSFGTHAIIMDAADRNLNQIYVQEQPDLSGLRTILTQVFEAVAHLHEKELMHGDLKLLNVVRFRRDNRLRLIDFDASAKIVPAGEEGK
jgi:RIO-like serine/threonine protein kinase